MTQSPRILVVEDEGIVARDLQQTLQRMGYQVAHPLATGEDAVRHALATLPDLVLMDIRLKGAMDGIEAAEAIRRDGRVPVVFLTAHSDEATLQRATRAEPFGYVVKPFEETDLRTAVEVAIYKHRVDLRVRQAEAMLATILRSMSDAVIGVDSDARVTFLNDAAERLLGIGNDAAAGQRVTDVVKLVIRETDDRLDDRVVECIGAGERRSLGDRVDVIGARGGRTPVDGLVEPLHGTAAAPAGAIVVLRDSQAEANLELMVRERDALLARLSARAKDLL